MLRLPASSLDLLDDEQPESPSHVDGELSESLWPQAITQPADKAFTN